MKKCPQCHADLANADLTQGKCPECSASLAEIVTPIGAGDANNATIGDVTEPSDRDDSSSDQADRQSMKTGETRKDEEVSRRTIDQDSERRTVDDPLPIKDATSSREEEQGPTDKTISDIGQTIDEPVIGPAATQGVNTIGDIEADPTKTIADQSASADHGDRDIGQTVSEDPTRTVDERVLAKDESSKTVVDITKTVELPSDDQQDSGRTIEESSFSTDASKTVADTPVGGKTIEMGEEGGLAGGQTIDVRDESGSDGGQTIEVRQEGEPFGDQTIELGASGKPVDPSKKTVPDGEINKTVEISPGDGGSGTVNDVNLNATVDISGEQPAKPGTVTDRNLAPTLDSTEVVSNVAQHINTTWGGSIGSEDTPRTSLKTNVADEPIGTKSDLVIQPRLFGKADEPRKRAAVDYNLLEMLGEGGMGMVYAARQASIDRTVAIKMLKPKTAQDEVQRCKFLAEAVVTGDLEHPNIVPIYDLGRNAEGALFYAMKRVQGTPWDEVVSKKSLSENIEILMKVADAIGFAHSRGIIHRDLKPENVMLGGFGEVLVMDWGLAIPTDNRLIGGLKPSTSMGGTPAYMAPEMATGPFERIGTHSDIYLLGAILFEIVTGKPPHTGKDVMKCLFAAARNQIQEVDDASELVEIALKAMSTDPQERHGSVIKFQDAIRQYLSHSESILLSDHAEKDLATASRTNDYQDYARALFGFQQAVELWDGNDDAKDGLSMAQIAYATSARDKGDFDLGASLLDAEKPDQVELLSEIREAKREVEARQQRLKTAKRAILALAAVFFIAITCALFFVLQARAEAETQREIAESQKEEAVRQKGEAEKNAKEALRQKGLAEVNLTKAKEEEAKAKAAAEQERLAKITAQQAEQKAKDEEAKAKLAEMKAVESAEQEKKAKIAALEAEKKAKESAEQEKKAKLAALDAEKKAKDEEAKAKAAELVAKAEEAKAKLAAEKEEKAKLAALDAEKKAKESAEKEKTAKLAALAAEKKARDEEAKAKLAAEQEMKAKIAAQEAEKKAKDEEAKAKAAELLAKAEEAKAKAAAEAEKKAKLLAIAAEAEAKRQAYVALISAAAAKIDENAFDSARQLLKECAPAYRNWEWGRLWYLCNQSVAVMDARAEIAAVDFSPIKGEDQFATGGRDGKVRIWRLKSDMSDSALVRTIDTGGEEVFALAYSPDGKQIAVGTGSEDGLLQIWDVASGTPVARIAGGKRENMVSPNAHTQDVVSVQFNAAGDLLLTSSLDSTAKIWDVKDKANPKVRSTLRGHTWWVWNARFSPNGQQILTVSDDGSAIVWTDRTGQWENPANIKNSPKFRGHSGPIFAGAFEPNGELVATAGYDQRVLLWKPGDLKEFDHEAAVANFGTSLQGTANAPIEAEVLEGHTSPIRSLTFKNSKEGMLLLTAGDDNTIRVWNLKQRGKSVLLRGHGKAVQGCDISPDSKWIVSGSLDGTARLWDLTRYKEQRVLRGDVLDAHEDAVLSADFSRDGSQIVTASRDGTAKTWDPTELTLEKTFNEGHTLREGHLFRAARAGFFAEDKYLATSAVDNTVRIWDVARGTQIDLLENTGRNAALAVTSDGSLIVTGSGSHGQDGDGFCAQVWEWKKGQKAKLRFKLGDHNKTVTQVAVSADKRFIATGDANGHCNLWDAQSGKRISGLAWHIEGITALTFLPDGSRLLTGDGKGNVVQWDLKSYQPLKQLLIQLGQGVVSMDSGLLPDNEKRAAVVCTDEGRVEMYDIDRGNRGQLLTLVPKYRCGSPSGVSFSNNGSRIMLVETPAVDAAGADTDSNPRAYAAAVHIFDSISGKEIEFKVDEEGRKGPFLYLGHNGIISSAAFNSDGTRVAAVGGNRAQLWNVNPDLEQAKREVMRFRPQGPIASARFSPNGKLIITGSWDATIKIWDTKTGNNELTLEDLHTRSINSVRFSADGTQALSASDDGTVKLWDVRTGKVQMVFVSEAKPAKKDGADDDTLGFTDAIFMPDGKEIAASSRDGTVRIWNRADGTIVTTLRTLDAQATELLCVAVSFDGRWLVAGGEKDASIWDLDADGKEPVATLSGHTAPVTSVEFSDAADHSHRLLTGSEDFTAKVWDTSKLWEVPAKLEGELAGAKAAQREVTEIMTLKGHTRAVTSVTFSPDGQYCLTASYDGTAIVWLTSPWQAVKVAAEAE